MPFQLAYKSDIVILAKVGLTSYRLKNYDKDKNKVTMRL